MHEIVLYISQENMCIVHYTRTPINGHGHTHTHTHTHTHMHARTHMHMLTCFKSVILKYLEAVTLTYKTFF